MLASIGRYDARVTSRGLHSFLDDLRVVSGPLATKSGDGLLISCFLSSSGDTVIIGLQTLVLGLLVTVECGVMDNIAMRNLRISGIKRS